MRKVLIVLCVTVIFSALSFSNTLSGIKTFTAGSYPRGIACADINSDGVKEVIAANFGSGTLIGQENSAQPSSSLSVFTKSGSDSFTSGSLSSGASPRGLASGDINSDGKDEFVATNYSDGTISIYEGNNITTLDAGKHPVGAAIGDVNNDGKNEVAVAVYTDNKIAVFSQKSKGVWIKTDVKVPGSPTDAAIGEVSGKQVIASANYTAGTVSLITAGETGFAIMQELKAGGSPCKVRIADVTGDGLADIVAANFGDSTVSVMAQTPSGSFADAVNYKLGGIRPNGMAVGDINNDGKLDVVTANRDDDTVDILLQKDGALVLTKTIHVTDDKDKSYGPVEAAIADLNGDGLADIAFTHMRTHTLKVIFQQPVQAPVITSLTHPSQEAWYTSKNVSFTLAAVDELNGVAGYLYNMSKSQAAFTASGAQLSVSGVININNLETGTYFISAATKDNAGNISAVSVYKVQITDEMSEKNVYNYPNPCSTSTVIRFPLAAQEIVKIMVTDVNGSPVWHKDLSAADTVAGVNEVAWNLSNDAGKKVANGVYIFTVSTSSKTITKKIAVTK